MRCLFNRIFVYFVIHATVTTKYCSTILHCRFLHHLKLHKTVRVNASSTSSHARQENVKPTMEGHEKKKLVNTYNHSPTREQNKPYKALPATMYPRSQEHPSILHCPLLINRHIYSPVSLHI